MRPKSPYGVSARLCYDTKTKCRSWLLFKRNSKNLGQTTRYLILLLALSGCVAQHVDVKPTVNASFAPWSEQQAEYRLSAGDSVDIKFLLNTELNDNFLVGPDGRATVPLLGRIDVANKTIPALRAELEQDYAKQLRVPQLDLFVRLYGNDRIYVGGQVNNPSVQQITGQINALQGVLLAGGLRNTAKSGQIVVLRRNENNQLMLRAVNLNTLIGSAQASEDFPLQPGDVLFVPESQIAEADQWIDQDINQLLPFTRGLDYTTGTTATTTTLR